MGDAEVSLREALQRGGKARSSRSAPSSRSTSSRAPRSARWRRTSATRSASATARSCSSARRRARSSCSARCRWAGWPTASGARASSAGRASLFAAMVLLSGLAVNAFSSSGPGSVRGSRSRTRSPVQGSLLADTYPIGVRGRMIAGIELAGSAAATLSPVLVGGIAALAGGDDGLALGVPPARHPGRASSRSSRSG